MTIDSKRIAKNTFFMYIRMIIIMGVTFFTSRVVLDKLGIDDYGLYNAVGGVVSMLSFITNTLANGTSRFITFNLGTNNLEKLKLTFSTAIRSHFLLMIVLLLVLETAGLWFLNHKLVIADSRLMAVQVVYQLSLLTMCFSILQIPFSSTVIAHEDMKFYAYLSIFEAIAKLVVVYLLSISTYDKLVVYASLVVIVQFIVFMINMIFCRRHYIEAKSYRKFNSRLFKEIISFSGWDVIAHLTVALRIQGSNILINMFFRPSLVAAQAVANQVTTALMNFVYQFTTALNPQIIKSYAVADYKGSQKLTLDATILVFDLVLIICLPMIFIIDPLLNLWLVEVPEMTVSFLRLALIAQILGVFNNTLYAPMVASGKLKMNSLFALFIVLGQYVVLYFLFRTGNDVLWLPMLATVTTVMHSLLIKPYILYKQIGYDLRSLIRCYVSCFKVLVPSVALSVGLASILDKTLMHYLLLVCGIELIILVNSWVFLKRDIKIKVLVFAKSKLRGKFRR